MTGVATQASARIIADSINLHGTRLTTFEAVCWRPMLAEQNTHGALARNSASSRARPVAKVLDDYKTDFAWPIVWPAERPGMQGGEDLTGQALEDARALWEDLAVSVGSKVDDYLASHPDPSNRLHKSLLNRWLEPGLWQTQIITATNLDGYFWQRRHRDAEPHIRAMADAMYAALEANEPETLAAGEWHRPYWAENGGHESDWVDAKRLAADSTVASVEAIATRCSVARCARVSFLTQHGVRDLTEDLGLYARLVENRVGSQDPPHASPLEHVATPWLENSHMVTTPGGREFGPLPRLGKFIGWIALRHEELGF